MKVRLKTLPDEPRGGAWLPSARTVRRAVKSVNERDPCPMLLLAASAARHSWGTARDKREEGTGDGKSVCPESRGPHAQHNGRYKGMPPRKGEQIP